MLNLTRFMILIAVAFLAARPVMACCLTGHSAPAAMQMSADKSLCHDSASAMDHSSNAALSDDQPPADCPGCSDCEGAIIQSENIEDSTLLASNFSETLYDLGGSRFIGFAYSPTVLTTGPPGNRAAAPATPLTLKQRLLI